MEKFVTILDLCSILSLLHISLHRIRFVSVKYTLCTDTWNNKHCSMDTLKLCTCKLSWSPEQCKVTSHPSRCQRCRGRLRRTHALVVGLGCELFRMKCQRNYRHQSKITGLRSVLSCIKVATNHTFCSMKCRFYAGTLVCGALQHICEELS